MRLWLAPVFFLAVMVLLLLVLLMPAGLDQRTANAATPSGRPVAVVWPVFGPVTSPYGERTDPVTGEKDRMHWGIDISAALGTPVQAATTGTVEFADYIDDYGNLVVLRSYDGIVTWYGHLSAIAVRPSEEVRQGEVIGYVGSTGKSTGNHLHFEVRVGKEALPIDPMQVVSYRAAEPAEASYPDDEFGRPKDFAQWVSVRVGVLELPSLSYVATDGQTMVQLRPLIEALEGQLDWDDSTQSATVRWQGKTVKLTLGQPLVEVDGRVVITSHSPALWNKNLMVPARLVVEGLGLRIKWDGKEDGSSVILP